MFLCMWIVEAVSLDLAAAKYGILVRTDIFSIVKKSLFFPQEVAILVFVLN